MAGDTRDNTTPRSPPSGATEPPDHVKSPKVYEVFNGPPQSANALPEGSGLNTAGSREKQPSFTEGIKTVRWQDFAQVHMYPCVRESLLMGIGGGFGMGGIRMLWGTPIWKACNWAVGTFAFAGLGNFEYCQYKRRMEKAYMKRAVEIIDRKKVEKDKLAEEKRAERRRQKEEHDMKVEEASRSKSWKFW